MKIIKLMSIALLALVMCNVDADWIDPPHENPVVTCNHDGKHCQKCFSNGECWNVPDQEAPKDDGKVVKPPTPKPSYAFQDDPPDPGCEPYPMCQIWPPIDEPLPNPTPDPEPRDPPPFPPKPSPPLQPPIPSSVA